MKPLILSFFAVILGFSLFTDKDENANTNSLEPVKITRTKTADMQHNDPDSIPLFANKSIKAE